MTLSIKPLMTIQLPQRVKQNIEGLLEKLQDIKPEPKKADDDKDEFVCPYLDLLFPDKYEDVLKMSDEERHKRMMKMLGPPTHPAEPGPLGCD